MNQRHVNINHQSFRKYIFPAAVLLICFIVFALPSCVHEPIVGPVDPGPDPDPIDTTENPIDTTTPGTPCDPNVVYFNMQILPLLKSNCAKSGCHDAITHEEDIILDSYQNVMASDVVRPYDLNDSEMFEMITESDPEERMPPPPNQRLNADQINLIAQWILQGAKDLTCDENPTGCNTTN